jgi:signal transduction histidine kinase
VSVRAGVPVPRGIRRIVSEVRQGWIDARLMIAMPGRDRALRMVAVILFGQRASYFLPAFAGLGDGGHDHYVNPVLNVVLLIVMIGWNVALGVSVWRRGWFTERQAAYDVVIACGLLLIVTANIRPAYELSAANWAAKFALGVASLAGAVLSIPRMSAALALLLGTSILSTTIQIGGFPPWESGFFSSINSSIWFALVLHFIRRFLCAQASAVEEATRLRLEAEVAVAAEQARFTERVRQYRKLHDTVLASLTAIARGGLDHRADEVRRRCANEADYVRRLLAEDDPEALATWGASLAEVVADAAAFDLRVHLMSGPVPPEVPDPVVRAMCDALREALNNVARHAGTGEAWVTTDWRDGTLEVRIVDRGVGFVPAETTSGFGLRRSIAGRMREVGAELHIFSEPDHGACVELKWTRPDQVG